MQSSYADPTPEGGNTQVEIDVVPRTTQLPLVSITRNYFFQIGCIAPRAVRQQVMSDDHSESVPPLPIPNRTVKRLHADDSADSRVKVGNRQAPLQHQKPHP